MGIVDKIKELENEYARTQKNKATEGHLGIIKAKLYRELRGRAPPGPGRQRRRRRGLRRAAVGRWKGCAHRLPVRRQVVALPTLTSDPVENRRGMNLPH